ncbi:hypothetical protein HK104_000025 [Borealophlyctis nickersoniae]|nr:hypothetical protein HK104_000025 [Borealophlyctis nickersoniae]
MVKFGTVLSALVIGSVPASFAAPTSPLKAVEKRAIPVLQDILPGEKITFVDQIASRVSETTWNVQFRGYVTRPLPDAGVDPLVKALYLLAVNKELRDRLDERIGAFYVAGIPGKKINIDLPASSSVNGSDVVSLPPTSIAGEFETSVNIDVQMAQETDGVLDYLAKLYALDKRQIGGRAFFVEPEGFSVISDIDDTIKVTEVNDIFKTLKHTFLDAYTPVAGMSELYNSLASALPGKPSFHYLSGSPWNLFPSLSAFTKQFNFPAGEFILKDLAILDGSFIDAITNTQAYKVASIESLIATFPKRKFVFIGDSTQQDPEAYADIAKKFPANVVCIAIRIVTGVNADKEKDQIAPKRFADTFAGVDGTKWFTFKDAAEVSAAGIAKGECKAVGK